jgi:hypothetical protein
MIEAQLLDYISSGQCYALVGSGPSCEMGYPTWHGLAVAVIESVKQRSRGLELDGYQKLLRQERYADIFERAKHDLTDSVLFEILRGVLKPKTERGEVYGYLAKWPFAGYLTTNYDDELIYHLRREGIHCSKLLNSPDDFRAITASSRDFVLKLHGEIGSAHSVLTSSDYARFRTNTNEEYYRQKIGALFSMFKICIVGFGLRDPDIEFVLEKAKQFSTPSNPVFMLSPGLDLRDIDDLFDKYNIRVVPYENPDGSHRQLRRIFWTYDTHIVPRENIHLSLPAQDREDNELASSLFLFTHLQLVGKNTTFLEDAAKSAVLTALRGVPQGLETNRAALAIVTCPPFLVQS